MHSSRSFYPSRWLISRGEEMLAAEGETLLATLESVLPVIDLAVTDAHDK